MSYKGERCVSNGEAELATHSSPSNQVTDNKHLDMLDPFLSHETRQIQVEKCPGKQWSGLFRKDGLLLMKTETPNSQRQCT